MMYGKFRAYRLKGWCTCTGLHRYYITFKGALFGKVPSLGSVDNALWWWSNPPRGHQMTSFVSRKKNTKNPSLHPPGHRGPHLEVSCDCNSSGGHSNLAHDNFCPSQRGCLEAGSVISIIYMHLKSATAYLGAVPVLFGCITIVTLKGLYRNLWGGITVDTPIKNCNCTPP